MAHGSLNPPDVPKLSARELEVLLWVARGKTYAEISELLAMAEDTAKDHVARASKKLNTKNKTHTVALAISHGYIKL